MSKRSCEELGVCQSSRPCPLGCSHDTEKLPPGGFWFAPGTVDCPPAHPRRWRALARELLLIFVLSGVVGLIAGLLTRYF